VCQECDSEFFVTGTATFFVIAPPTNTQPPPPPPTNTLTSVPLIPNTSTPTPTLAFCGGRVEAVYPERNQIFAADTDPDTIDWVFDVFYSGVGPEDIYLDLVTIMGFQDNWPDPDPETDISMVPIGLDGMRFTVRGISWMFGYNGWDVNLIVNCPGGDVYDYDAVRFSIGDEVRGEISPAACGDLGLGEEAEVFSFEGYVSISYYGEEAGVDFEGSISVASLTGTGLITRSGYYYAATTEAMEFGSSGQLVRMNFLRPITALGMYVGNLDDYTESGEIDAVLKVYGYSGGSESLTLLGSATTSFPAEPTDILECISFQAAEGDLIARATLDYLVGGISAAERRVLDDLTFVYSEQELPQDMPPEVDITAPTDTGIITAAYMPFRVNIVEDRALNRVWYQVGDGELQEVGFRPLLGDDPTQYYTLFNLTTGLLDYAQPNTITVIAEDSAGQRDSDSVILTLATPIPELDLSVYKVEIIQTIQCHEGFFISCGPDNSIRMLYRQANPGASLR
jgi:hypothetical protein